MIVVGSLNTNKTDLLIQEYIRLIKAENNPCEILFLALNGYKKEQISSAIKAFEPGIIPNVQTFLGLCYNSILKNQSALEKLLPQKTSHPFTLCGLEVSQNLLFDAVKQAGFKDYNSKINLMHQLLRRHALIVENNLSEKEIEKKSAILNETFSQEAKTALNIFKSKTLELRTFDYLRQQSLFQWLYQNTQALKNIKHIIIDDYDEQTPSCTDFFKFIKPQLKSYTIGIDPNGSSRCGYLCADLNCIEILNWGEKIINAKPLTPNNKENPHITSNSAGKFIKFHYTKRLEMLQACAKEVISLVKQGSSPEDISIISPVFDEQFKFVLQNSLANNDIKIQFISGSKKLVESPFIKSILSLLKLINSDKELHAGIDELSCIFSTLLNIPIRHTCQVLKSFKEKGGFIKHDFLIEEYNNNYQKLLSLAQKVHTNDTLEAQLDKIYKDFICSRKNTEEEITEFNFLKKQIQDLEKVVAQNEKNKIITQLENSIIAETDAGAQKIERNTIIAATAQKLIDYEIKTKHQFWLDTTSDDWIKQDTGTIYNAWVFAKSWNKEEFTYEDSINCVKNKTSRVLRKLKLLATDKIYAYSSDYSPLGLENNQGINEFIIHNLGQPESLEAKTKQPNFEPRPDQKPVLEYTNGKLAITAVPGAGKTTVLQALITKLLDNSINGENIFVLTYMDSAAKNLKTRISNTIPPDKIGLTPNISTIHGLALRIIKENSNYTKVNLGDDFEVCDELTRQRLIRETIGELNLKYDEYEKYEKGISIAKTLPPELKPQTRELREFISFYQKYQKKLSQNNLIDYDDMLNLAVKILEENPQILNYYQNLCKYILEDEAQDSSAVQQRLIMLLSGLHKNVVRCGDINQAITSTFTNADTNGFKIFISQNNSIEMNHSQRCAKGIYTLANQLIKISEQSEEKKGAFYKIEMKGVLNKNPISETPLITHISETEQDEKNYLISKIKDILKTDASASCAILLRNNFQVSHYAALLRENGITTISKTDCPEQIPIFNIILNILKFCSRPWDNSVVQKIYEILNNTTKENLYLSNLEVPFISIDAGCLDDKNLISLHWELNYWLSQINCPIEQFALKVGEYYAQNDLERSNLYIIIEIIKKLTLNSNHNELTTKLEQIATRPTIAGLKLFSEDETTLSTKKGGTVQVMTMHKAKGDEFDYVFVPEFSENSLASSIKNIKSGNYTSFYEDLKSLNASYAKKTISELKKEILQENLRLLYVTITRAKKRIIFTAAQKYKKFGRLRQTEPSYLFETLLKD